MTADELKSRIRDVPDFPRAGILFKDITPLLLDGRAFHAAIEQMAAAVATVRPDVVVGIEARGFLFAAAVAFRLGVGMAPVRKPGKLPWRSVAESYALEYGSDELHIHADAFPRGARIVVVDDVLATGGTAVAVGRLVRRLEGDLSGYCFLMELGFLDGRAKLGDVPTHAILGY